MKKLERLGEKRRMNCGMVATIIAYHDCNNISIQFEDGEIHENVSYARYVSGSIKNSNVINAKTRNRLGEIRKMVCGVSAKIIAYRSSHDLDIQFEDGTICEHVKYSNYKNGNVRAP